MSVRIMLVRTFTFAKKKTLIYLNKAKSDNEKKKGRRFGKKKKLDTNSVILARTSFFLTFYYTTVMERKVEIGREEERVAC